MVMDVLGSGTEDSQRGTPRRLAQGVCGGRGDAEA